MDSALDRACDPKKSKKERAAAREKFAGFVNEEESGAQIAIKLLIAKLQSTNPEVCTEALSACDVCVRQCGKPFHEEIGKFRFLNEFVKLVSPKFSGGRTPAEAKQKIKILLYDWSEGLPKQPKIKEAFEMLRKQGIITDADIPKAKKEAVPDRPKMAPFEDKKKAALLQRLLASKHPEDLQAANRLIQEMVKQDDAKFAKMTQQLEDLEIYQNNIKLLREMLAHYEEGQSQEIITELQKSCVAIRPKLQMMAQGMKEGDKRLADVLRASDDLTNVLDSYIRMFGSGPSNPTQPSSAGAAVASTSSPGAATGGQPSLAAQAASADAFDLLGDLGAPSPVVTAVPAQDGIQSSNDMSLLTLDSLDPLGDTSNPAPEGAAQAAEPARRVSLMDDLAMLDLGSPSQPQAAMNIFQGPPSDLGQQGGPGQPPPSQLPAGQPAPMVQPGLASQPGLMGMNMPGQAMPTAAMPTAAPAQGSPATQRPNPPAQASGDGGMFVPIESIKMSQKPPAMVYDKSGLRLLLYSAENTPAPNVDVYVLSAMSTNTAPISDFNFQAAVPKTMRVKLQPASSSELPAHSPLAAPVSLSQVMLVANPAAEPLRLRFKLSFSLQGQPITEMGEVSC